LSDGEEPFDDDNEVDDDDARDDVVSAQDQERVASLTAVELQVIDASILSHATVHWKKVLSLMKGDDGNSLPYQFYVRRVARLAATRKLESQGDLRRMRHSEVRLPGSYDWPRA
jgi:hypothetical protein